ncbi:hypothetical protein CMI47_01055 [Candidatus Pacearchaeota archaeon]|nr:hypothetical protein [Candidatus Pacearchaeota archaeon]|tara:strand:+ start:554 stop:1036 length:483 start_codon:yes stop_codon:yes gene_type:complete
MYPKWKDKREELNLREVGPGIFVGAEKSVTRPPKGGWYAVIDLYGESAAATHSRMYREVDNLVRWPFFDGDEFPKGLLDMVSGVVRARDKESGGPILIHCQAGLSRSASAAYAMLRHYRGLSHEEAHDRVSDDPESWPVSETLWSARKWVWKNREEASPE